jgi:hypothetical protein
MKFTDLLTGFGSSWPEELVNTSLPPTDDITGLLAQIDAAIELHDAAADVGSDGTLTLTATLKITTGSAPADTRLVSRLFPSMQFIFRPGLDWSSDFRCSIATDGSVTVQVDTLPLDVLLPPDLLAAHPDPEQHGADSKITLSVAPEPSVITRDFALILEADGLLRLEPHLPISVGPCRLMGVPCRAVHDILLICAPARASKIYDWVVRPLNPDLFLFESGGLGFGGIEFDFETADGNLAAIRRAAHIRQDAELVIEDVVIPANFFPPLPQHGTIGLRRSLAPGESLEHNLSFQDAPIQFPVGNAATVFFDQLFFRTPPEDEPLVSGLTLEAGITVSFGEGGNDDWDFSLGLIDGDVVRLSIAHSLPPAGTEPLPVLNIDVWFAVVDILRARFGVSLGALQKTEVDASEALQVLGDILIRGKPDSSSSPVQAETEDGKPFEKALVDFGWDRGSFTGSLVGQQDFKLKMGPFALEIHDAGFVAEDGATYFSLSGGIRESTDPFTGRVFFERLRGRLAGNPDAPGFKLGGFGAELEVKDTVEIQVHGNYRNEVLPDGTRLKEHGLGGKLTIYASKAKWGLSLDVYWGERIPVTDPPIDYSLLQSVLFGAIPVSPLELRQVEALYADNLLPKLSPDEPAVGQLKYYPWLKKAEPTALPENRGLTAWKPTLDAWAFGAGFAVGFTGCGEMLQASAFALGFDSETESGLIVVIELKILGNDKPIAIGVLEYDFRRDAFILQIVIDIKLQDLIENFPERLNVRLGGTITIGNRPGLVAIGRIDSQATWIGAEIAIELNSVATLKVRIAVCFEWLEAAYVGGGFVFSISVESRLGPMKLKGWGSLLVLLRFMLSGTNDFVARIAFEMGFAIVLFGFLRFGISMSLLADWLAHVPNFFVFRATFRLETPWFMPDFSVTVECASGTLNPPARAMLTGALFDASARSLAGTRTMRIQRIDGLAGSVQPQLMALDSLPPAATASTGQAMPVPLDATIEIQFAPMLADRVGIGQTNPDLGRQTTGDGAVAVESLYELVGVQVRRRPRGTTAWTVVEDFAGPGDPRKGRWSWDIDTRTGGETAPKKLLYNGSTPFSVAEDNPLADAETLEENPAFPCCSLKEPDVARLDFCDSPFGAYPAGFARRLDFVRRGTPSPVRARIASCAIHPPVQPGAACDRVAGFIAGRPVSLTSEEDLAEVTIAFAAVARKMTIMFLARDREGEVADRIVKSLSGNLPFDTLTVHPARVFTTLDILIAGPDRQEEGDDIKLAQMLEIDWIECLLEADRAHAEDDRQRCDRVDEDGHGAKAPFLPQQEYEIRLTTRIGIRHTSTEPETRTIVESAGFVTAGIPGLNETVEPGLELRPYVVSRPAGGRGNVYRDESVHLVLSSDLTLFGPGASGDDEAGFRYPVTLTVGTRLDSRPEAALERSSFESNDWFLDHRGGGGLIVTGVLHDLIVALSDGGLRGRYQALSSGSPATCPPDDTWVENHPRLGIEPFDAAGRSLWQARNGYHAAMRPAGGPVVARAPFEAADISAFLATTGSWTVEGGLLKAAAPATGRFGESDWDSFGLLITGSVEAGGQLAAAVLIDAANPGGGLRFTVVANPDGSGALVAEPVVGGAPLSSQPIPALPATLSLRVETFADRIRAGVAGVTLSIDRGARKAGLCEIGAAAAAIVSLTVRGLEMYGFDFDTSRYRSFAEHVASAGGLVQLPIVGAEETIPQLLSRLGGEIATAMRPEAPDSERERVFGEVARSLAVPLREAPDRFYLELATGEGGDRWLVLEGPEPLDLVEEVTLRLRHREPLPPIDPDLVGRVRAALADLFEPRPFPLPPPLDGHRRAGRAPIGRSPAMLGPRGTAALADLLTPDVRPLPGGKPFISVVALGARLLITALATGNTVSRPANGLSRRDLRALAGITLFFDRAGRLVDWTRPDDSDLRDVGFVAIQSATRTQALVIPRTPLPSGDYRLDFEITRRWFDTSAAPGPDNAYHGQASLDFTLS